MHGAEDFGGLHSTKTTSRRRPGPPKTDFPQNDSLRAAHGWGEVDLPTMKRNPARSSWHTAGAQTALGVLCGLALATALGGRTTSRVTNADAPDADAEKLKFEISFPASVHAQPITGRVFVMLTRQPSPEPRLQVGAWQDPPPLFGVDVNQLKAGAAAVIDGATLGFPPRSLSALSAGDYYVQALANVYTEFHRSDCRTIWAHMDQWEGQQFDRSPGNLYSETQRVHLDPRAGYDVKLELTQVIPPVAVPPETAWVKRIKIESKL